MAHLSDYNTDKRYRAKVLNTRRLTPEDADEVREIKLEVQDKTFDCQVDQSFGVLIETRTEFGNNAHHRLYSVSDLPYKNNGKPVITFLVKRCTYIDDFNGEEYKGVASHYLCDRRKGDEIIITGPFPLAFNVPEDKTANLILIGMGTGIAPFRAFIKHLYENEKDWAGKIYLYYGAKSGLELLYMNDKENDLTNYYDEKTFKAFHAVSPRPDWVEAVPLHETIEDTAEDIVHALLQNNTYIYVAGYEKVKENLDKAFSNILGSQANWLIRKRELIAGKKWAEVIY